MTGPSRTRVRGLCTGPQRSAEFRAGHRRALRAAIAWLHAEAESMNDPKARQVLQSAAFGLGQEARLALNESQSDDETPDGQAPF